MIFQDLTLYAFLYAFDEEMKTLLNNNIEFYKRIVDNEKLKNQLKSLLFDSVCNAFVKETKKKS